MSTVIRTGRKCAICGYQIMGLHVYSSVSRRSYCADLKNCAVRAKRTTTRAGAKSEETRAPALTGGV